MQKSFKYTVYPKEIPTAKVVSVRENRVWYACPQQCWSEHLEAWRKARRNGAGDIPEPMPYGHLCFERPASYGCVAYGDTSEESIRLAWEHCFRADLSGGWMADGPAKDELVKRAAAAKMAGIDVGASHYLCAVASWL